MKVFAVSVKVLKEMDVMSLVLVGLLHMASSVESTQSSQNYPLLATKVKHLETQVQIFSSLLQTQSTIIARYITQGQTGTSTTDPENNAKIAKQAKEIQELQEKMASLDILTKTQEDKIKQLSDNLVKLKGASPTPGTDKTVGASGTIDVTTINKKLRALNTSSKAHDFQIKRLEGVMTSTKTDIREIKERQMKTSQKLSALQTSSKTRDSKISDLEFAKTSANIRIAQNQKDRIVLANKVKAHASQINQLQSSVRQGTWATGKYCILASGSCPAGFTRVTAWMKALKVYRGTGGYFRRASFGDSNIRCHGACSRGDQWVGELTIVACCK